MIKKFKSIYKEIYRFGQLCKSNHLDSHSAAAAFFIFVSIIPTIILILALIPYTPITNEGLLEIIRMTLPDGFENYAANIVEQLTNKSITLVSISAITALWSASRGVLTIKQGINEIHSKTDYKNFLLLRINAAFYTMILIVAFILMIIFNIVFAGVDRYFREILGISMSAKYDLVYILMTLRPLITIVLGFIMNLYFFSALPMVKVSIKEQIPGAAIVALIWYVFSLLFMIYINYFNAFSMYGSLSIVIIILMWLYACMYIMFLGAQFNYYLSLRKENNTI